MRFWAKGTGKLVIGSVSALLLFLFCLLALPPLLKEHYVFDNKAEALAAVKAEDSFIVRHVSTPEAMKGIYMTACVADTHYWREDLKNFIKNTELNSVIIDVKDYSGTISFRDESFKQEGAKGCVVRDLREFIGELHDENIYVIARITVFQDSLYTQLFPEVAVKKESDGGVWRDFKGLSFVDVGAKPYWDYVVNLAQKSYDIGFDEINFDYIRYPSDGNMKDVLYTWMPTATTTRAEMLGSFFKYLRDNLGKKGIIISADLFGMTTTHPNDLGIGQVLEDALTYFDFVYPMVYPSHYPDNWSGFSNPADHPYEVIKIAMQGGLNKERVLRESLGISTSTPSKLRPWIQDFDLGANYGPKEVRDQIQATYDVGINSWLIWDAGNRYTREAFLPQ